MGLRRPTGLEEVALHSGLDTEAEVEAGRKGPSDDSSEELGVRRGLSERLNGVEIQRARKSKEQQMGSNLHAIQFCPMF